MVSVSLQLHHVAPLGDGDAPIALRCKRMAQLLLPLQISVDEEDLLQPLAVLRADELEQSGLVGVRREVVLHRHLGSKPVWLPENVDDISPLNDALSQRVLGHEADDHHGVLRVLEIGRASCRESVEISEVTGYVAEE